MPSSGCYGSTKHATKRLGVFFLFGAGEFREVDFLIVENVKRGTKATHLERSNGYDPELNLKVRESSGSVRLECFLTERKHIMRCLTRRPYTEIGDQLEVTREEKEM